MPFVYTAPYKGSLASRLVRFMFVALFLAAAFFLITAIEVRAHKPTPRSHDVHSSRTPRHSMDRETSPSR